eukprot:CAMPEP_0119072648 /NCGR_PEP_ID=MMETSP1178-20130426/58500_1 /TAXON_ID=33656 /ORGANISM="unid sp, Strain CCMP2000" /LENGTH=139 /DNA_ID=CAMNT_0007054673 /DNA_START=20 /DNA_END=439 /DNA_ORIENTATION=+
MASGLVMLASCEAYTLLAVPRVEARVMAPQMLVRPRVGPDFGDNTYERREKLSTYGGGARTEGSVREETKTFSPHFGDNTYERRASLSQFTGRVVPTQGYTSEATRDSSPDFTGEANTFSPDFGDNTYERRRSLSKRSA